MDPVLAGNCSCVSSISTIHGGHNGVTVSFRKRQLSGSRHPRIEPAPFFRTGPGSIKLLKMDPVLAGNCSDQHGSWKWRRCRSIRRPAFPAFPPSMVVTTG
jgi:hypothetical protein